MFKAFQYVSTETLHLSLNQLNLRRPHMEAMIVRRSDVHMKFPFIHLIKASFRCLPMLFGMCEARH